MKNTGSSSACFGRANNQCCKHVISTKTGQTYQIRHNLNCHSRNLIYLGECNLCQNTQYICKSKPPVNLRINTHRYDVNNPKAVAFDEHFLLPGHNFNVNAGFTLIEQVRTTTNTSKQTIKQLLENRGDFWITKLKTITPNGLNAHLNSAVSNQIRVICS